MAGLSRIMIQPWLLHQAQSKTLHTNPALLQMMNRSCLVRTLQRPRAGLRKGTRRSISANPGIGGSSSTSSPGPAASTAPAAAEDIDVNREIAILKKLDHPNVVKLYEVNIHIEPEHGSTWRPDWLGDLACSSSCVHASAESSA